MYSSNLTAVLLRGGVYNLPLIFILLYIKTFTVCVSKKTETKTKKICLEIASPYGWSQGGWRKPHCGPATLHTSPSWLPSLPGMEWPWPWEMTHPQRFQVAFPAPREGQGCLNFGKSKKHPGVAVEMQTPEVKEVRPQIFYARGPQTSVGQWQRNEIRAIAEGPMSSDSAWDDKGGLLQGGVIWAEARRASGNWSEEPGSEGLATELEASHKEHMCRWQRACTEAWAGLTFPHRSPREGHPQARAGLSLPPGPKGT